MNSMHGRERGGNVRLIDTTDLQNKKGKTKKKRQNSQI